MLSMAKNFFITVFAYLFFIVYVLLTPLVVLMAIFQSAFGNTAVGRFFGRCYEKYEKFEEELGVAGVVSSKTGNPDSLCNDPDCEYNR